MDNDIKEILRKILSSENRMMYAEAFMNALMNSMETDDERPDKAGYHALKAIREESFDDFLIAICGWSLKSLMKKAFLLDDTDAEFHDEICDADFVSVWNGGVDVRSKCKVNTRTHEIFEIELSKENPDNLDILEREYVEIDGNEFPAFCKDELCETDRQLAFWYGEDE